MMLFISSIQVVRTLVWYCNEAMNDSIRMKASSTANSRKLSLEGMVVPRFLGVRAGMFFPTGRGRDPPCLEGRPIVCASIGVIGLVLVDRQAVLPTRHTSRIVRIRRVDSFGHPACRPVATKREALMSAKSSKTGSPKSDKGRESVQRMLDGQESGKLAGAKDALKKKILRLVMQQAMEELGDAETLAAESFDSIELDQEDLDRLANKAKAHLVRRAAREVSEADLDEIADAAAQAAVDGSEVDEAASRVETKLLAAISDRALAGLADDGATIKNAFESIATANSSAIEALAEDVQEKLCTTIAAKAWSGGIDADRVVELAGEAIDPTEPSVADAITRIQASAGDIILQSVLSQLSGNEASVALADEAANRFKERIMGIVSERVISDPAAIAKELEAELGPDHEAIVSTVRTVRSDILAIVRERSMASLEDTRAAAREALVELDLEDKKIASATTALTRKITQHIADQALEKLGDAESAGEAALKLAADHELTVATAANTVYETMARHVAEQARERCTDPDALADAARDYMDPKDGHVARAVSVLQTRLTELVAHRAVASLEEDDRMQALALEVTTREDAVVEATVESLREQIMTDIIRQVGESFSDAGETARKAKVRMGSGNAALIAATEVLKELVMEDLAKQATYTLLEPEKAGAKAFERIDTKDPRFVRATEKVRERVMSAIAETSLSEIQDADEAAREARTHISDTDDAIVSATAILRDLLINEIAELGTASLDDTRTIARQSRGRIESDDKAIQKASGALRELLIKDMVKMTKSALDDAQAAAHEAMAQLDPADEVLSKVRAVFKERVLINVLGEAMREIGQSVTAPNQEGAMFQQALHAMTSSDAPRAGAWNGSGYQPSPTAPGPSKGTLTAEPPTLSVNQAPEMVGWPSAQAASSEWAQPAAPVLSPGEPASTDAWVKLSDIDDTGEDRMVAVSPPEPMDDLIVTEFVTHDSPEQDDAVADVAEVRIHEAAEEGSASIDGWPEATGTPSEPAPQPASNPEDKKPEPTPDLDMSWAADDGLRCYVYGYVSAPEIAAVAPEGVKPIDEAHPIRFVTLRGVRAVISKVSADQFSAEILEARSKDTEWLKVQIRHHATVLDAFKSSGTVVPVRFGQVFDNEADVAVMMGNQYDEIVSTLERLKDKQEWSLRVTRDAEKLQSRINASERAVQDSLEAISTGVAQFIKDEMVKSGELMDDELIATITENCLRRTHDALMPCAVDGAQKALITAPGVDLVYNAAYLVEAGQVSDFKSEVDALATELETIGFTFDLSGPWPAYHFVETDDPASAEFVSAVK